MKPLYFFPLAFALMTLSVLAGCGPKCSESEENVDGACIRIWEWPEVVTTLTQTVVMDDWLETRSELNPVLPEGLEAAKEAGLGGWQIGPGEPHLVVDDLVPGHGSGSGIADRQSVTFFGHHTDDQFVDPESPLRIVNLDNPIFPGSARTQELYLAQATDAMVRTLNVIAADHGLEYVFLTGDNADSAQRNETRWLIDVLDGVSGVHIDSGDDNQAPDEWGNDPMEPFDPQGFHVPWYTVAGNHDLLINGIFLPEQADHDTVVGDFAPNGTRDFTQPGGPSSATTVADPQRVLLDRMLLVDEYFDTAASPGPIGHGFQPLTSPSEPAFFEIEPVPGIPLRFIGIDTTNPNGTSDGFMELTQFNDLLLPALAQAQADGMMVIVASHHEHFNIAIEGMPNSTFVDTLAASPVVIAHVFGHGHENLIEVIPGQNGGNGFVAIETSALADWPMQSRLIEIVANGDGTLSVYGTLIDAAVPSEHPAWVARSYTAIEVQTRWEAGEGPGTQSDRNVEVILPVPAGIETALLLATSGRSVRTIGLP